MASCKGMAAWFVVLVAADLGSKSLAGRVDGVTFIDPTSNAELMLGLGDLSVPLLVLLSTMVVALGAYGASRLVAASLLHSIAIPIGIAGFAGNVIDRVLFGHVRDWLVLGPTVWNLADFFLAAAIVMIVVAGIRSVLTDPTPVSQQERREGVNQ